MGKMRCCNHAQGTKENCGFLLLLPVCDCGISAKVKCVAKHGPNHGREFYSCGARGYGSCQYFEWKDPGAGVQGAGSSVPASKRQRITTDPNEKRYDEGEGPFTFAEFQQLYAEEAPERWKNAKMA